MDFVSTTIPDLFDSPSRSMIDGKIEAVWAQAVELFSTSNYKPPVNWEDSDSCWIASRKDVFVGNQVWEPAFVSEFGRDFDE